MFPPPVDLKRVKPSACEQFRSVFRREISNTMTGALWYAILNRKSITTRKEMIKMLWTIIVILGILWLLGFSFHVGGSLIHLLLVVAVVALVFNLLSGRRAI
jgi:hypothetical protein